MKTIVAFRFNAVVNAAGTFLNTRYSYLINMHHHFKKRKNNELYIFTT